MVQGRVLCKISLLVILLISISAYAPRDFLGVYDKAEAVVQLQDGQRASAEGYVYHKEIKKDKVLYFVRNASITTRSGTLSKTSFIFTFDSDIIPNFSKLNIEGKIRHFSRATNDGCFDMRDYYNSLGLYFELTDIEVYDFSCNYFAGQDFGFKLQQSIAKVYEVCLPGEEAGFLSSVTVGDKSGLDMELKVLFQEVGIAHILAVSGLHVSVICMAIYRFLRKRGISFGVCGFFAGTVAVMYGFITGGSVSSIRAIGMFLIYLLAQVAGESYDMLTAMAVMADFLLLGNPLFLKNGSFIFSFGAVLCIFYFVLPLNNVYTNYRTALKKAQKPEDKFFKNRISPWRWLFQYTLQSMLFSFGMFVAMLPLVTQLYYQTPLYSTFLNILILPLMPIVLGVGIIGGLLGTVFMPLGKLVLFPCHLIIYFYEMLSVFAKKLPYSTVVVGRHSSIAFVLYYLALICFINGVGRFFDFRNSGGRSSEKLVRIYRKTILLDTFLMILIAALWLAPRNGSFEIDFLDVGQGDGIYINSGEGQRFFIDGGSSSADKLGQYTLQPFLKYKGAGSIDYWFLSHMDLDHVSGVLELLEQGYRIKNIVLSSEIPEGETLDELLSLASRNGTNIVYMKQGDICSTKHLSFTCVYPYQGMVSEDVNDLSLCLLMEYKKNGDLFDLITGRGSPAFSAFLGGDIATAQEQAIAASNLVGHIDLLKVSHHGSRFSSDSAFLEALSPDIAVISCSKTNRYGHPSDEAILRIESAGSHIYYTMNSGRVRVTEDGIDEFN